MLLSAIASVGCYGYNTEISVTPLTEQRYPPTRSVALHFRAPTKEDRCLPLALIEVAGSDGETPSEGLETLQARARDIGANALFSVTTSRATRTEGNLVAALDPHNKEDVYSSHVVSGLAVRCVQDGAAPPPVSSAAAAPVSSAAPPPVSSAASAPGTVQPPQSH